MTAAEMLSAMRDLLSLAEQELEALAVLCSNHEQPSATRIRHIIQSTETANHHLKALQALAVDLRNERTP